MGREKQRADYLIKNTVIFTIGSIATKMIAFFLVPLYTNVLTTSQYGVVDLITTICMVLAPTLVLNIMDGVLRFSMDKNADHTKIMSVGLALFVLSIFIGLLIFPISSFFDKIKPYSIYIYFYTLSLALSQISLCYLRGKEFLVKYAIGNIIQTFLTGILNIIYLLVLHQGIEGYFKAYILAGVITSIYSFLVGGVFENIKHFKLDKKLSLQMIKYSVILIPNNFIWWIINSSDRIMISSMISSSANGIYAVSYKLPSLVSVLSGIFNQAWCYSAVKENDSDDRDQYTNNVYNGICGIAIISGVGLIAIMKSFLKIYVEQSYYSAWKYSPFLVVGYVFLTLATFLATPYTVNKYSKGYLFSSTFGAIVNIILNFIFIPIIGIAGAALATGLSYIAVFIYRVIDTRKFIHLKILNKQHIIGFLVLFCSAATIFIDNILGQVLLFVEFAFVVIIFNNIWLPLVKNIIKKIRK